MRLVSPRIHARGGKLELERVSTPQIANIVLASGQSVCFDLAAIPSIVKSR